MNLFINTHTNILLRHLDLRVVVQGQKHIKDEVFFVVFVQLLVNQHRPVVLHLQTALNDGTHWRKRGHAPFNMARREVHRRLNVGMLFLYVQNTEAQIMLRLCGNVTLHYSSPLGNDNSQYEH